MLIQHPLKPIYHKKHHLFFLPLNHIKKQFYYSHSKNDFWNILSKVFDVVKNVKLKIR